MLPWFSKGHLNATDSIYGDRVQQENDRLDLQHQMLKVATDDKLLYAPIGDDPTRILDLGCGTGRWCVDMG